ncbi:cutinase family protein [Mycobacterium sp. ACS4331]|uniref:cutinase family protein n=1 Tax=Mycobacterium sp. ACS4331 TaxID=1834121 RepID=UPI001E38366B|nr:cutinase family protein [Mycobacterium sp. ACS4331]
MEGTVVLRRIGAAALAAAVWAAAWACGTAAAAPTALSCADFHWIGAAGSGQRDGAKLAVNDGMGDVVYQTYQQVRANVVASGRTITAEAVQYPAAPVPLEGGFGGWLDFLGSVDEGTDATAAQFEAFTERCPDTLVVLAGYSQGAMIVHRNLYDIGEDPQLAAALLIADGDRLPSDTTIKMGSTAYTPGVGMGVAQEHSFLASTNTSPLPPAVGARTISVCDVGDPVCDYDPDSDEVSPASVAIHTAYAPAASGAHAWGAPLLSLLARAEAQSPGRPVA